MIDGIPYLVLDSLAELFCDNRNDISRNTIEELLNGEYENYGWSSYDLTDNIYRDVIEELTKENLRNLKEYIVKGLERDQ
jgi:methionine salvage enolase-phosphatase E1